MSSSTRVAWLVLLATLTACGTDRGNETLPAGKAGVDEAVPAGTARAAEVAHVAAGARIAGGGRGFAYLPDRGDLVAYPGNVVHERGAYRWHRAQLSEAHALRAIADGHLRVTTPQGDVLDVRYDRHVEHPSGDWTWIGHVPGQAGAQTILTFGAQAAFGSIAQPGRLPLRLTVRDGVSWLVETDPAKVAGIVNAATRPHKRDYHLVRRSDLPGGGTSRAGGPTPLSATKAATAKAGPLVDLIIGYTPGFAAANGGTSGALTQLNHLVQVANAAYRNSQVGAEVRLVHAMQVSYTDSNSNGLALEQLSGYRSGVGPVPPSSAFNALRAARETYGADLVMLVRKFMDPEHDGCGMAWLLGGGKQGMAVGEGWDELGYSVVSDGSDQGSDGKTYFCRDETLAHELGHNMGSAHDRTTSAGDDGVLDDPDDYGAYQFSFGYKTNATSGNFFTVMAYGESGQIPYRVFSNPRTTFCGGRACGTATWEDNARSLGLTTPVVATFRATTVPVVGRPRLDFNGDGISDILWRHYAGSGANVVWRSANSATTQAVASVPSQAWKPVGIGDFDGNGTADIFWRNTTNGANTIWRSGNSATIQAAATVADVRWTVVGIGDFDGNGRSDVLWRHTATGANAIWKSANSTTQQGMTTIASQAWKVVGIGDFNGDGQSDVLWRNSSTGANTIWRSGRTAQGVVTVPLQSWIVAGVGDFDDDGRSDIFWRNTGSGANVIWRSANSATTQGAAAVALAWKVVTVADFNGDGRSDVLWRNTSNGANAIWRSGNSATQQAVTTVPDQSWGIVP